MDIIRKFKHVTVTLYGLYYAKKKNPEAGVSLPCDVNGVIIQDEMTPEKKENLQECIDNKEDEYLPPVVQKYVHSYKENALGRCRCGEDVELASSTNECAKCGELYNLFGQNLAPYSQWRDEWNAYDD